ncbi:sulfurtransferase complex subunit TusB [Marinobacterium jannaschii]|uniref:sulfurtransferase complex subunit TusB n=1 Tax=Marinobacterium jannaschii TaxID=64970 RepID=UPI0004863305|nr:sulfurtransferase complex subunit TusB [Marinobacterium jannaschii]
MALHTLNRAPADSSCLQDCLNAMTPGDELILIEDGVYHALPAHIGKLEKDNLKIWVLSEDAHARGISARLAKAAIVTDSAGFVGLCCSQDKVVSWF